MKLDSINITIFRVNIAQVARAANPKFQKQPCRIIRGDSPKIRVNITPGAREANPKFQKQPCRIIRGDSPLR